MTSRRHNFQFRLPEDVEDMIIADAKRRKVSPNEYVRSLVISSMMDADSSSARSDMMLKLAATTAFQMTHFAAEMLRQINPHLSEEEIIKMGNEKIFTPSRKKAEEIVEKFTSNN